jgi:hypothetical protein
MPAQAFAQKDIDCRAIEYLANHPADQARRDRSLLKATCND